MISLVHRRSMALSRITWGMTRLSDNPINQPFFRAISRLPIASVDRRSEVSVRAGLCFPSAERLIRAAAQASGRPRRQLSGSTLSKASLKKCDAAIDLAASSTAPCSPCSLSSPTRVFLDARTMGSKKSLVSALAEIGCPPGRELSPCARLIAEPRS